MNFKNVFPYSVILSIYSVPGNSLHCHLKCKKHKFAISVVWLYVALSFSDISGLDVNTTKPWQKTSVFVYFALIYTHLHICIAIVTCNAYLPISYSFEFFWICLKYNKTGQSHTSLPLNLPCLEWNWILPSLAWMVQALVLMYGYTV